MKETKKYFLHKDKKTKEISYIEFSHKNDYVIKPKVKLDDIKVNKIVITGPDFGAKIARKKVEIAYRHILEKYSEINNEDEDEGTDNGIRETLMNAERLKLALINKYIKQLGPEFRGLTLQKLEMLINDLRMKLYMRVQQREYNKLVLAEEAEEKKGRGR